MEELINKEISVVDELKKVLDAFQAGDIVDTVLEMDEDKFNILNEILLSELEKSFNRPNERIQMIEAMRLTNVSLEDIAEMNMEIINQMQERFRGKIKANKINFLSRMIGLITNSIADSDGVYKRAITVPVVKMRPIEKLPEYKVAGDYALQVYSLEDYDIAPGEIKRIPLGIGFILPKGYAFETFTPKRMLAKTDLRVEAMLIGPHDQEEVELTVKNLSTEKNYVIDKNSVVADLVLREYPVALLLEMEEYK